MHSEQNLALAQQRTSQRSSPPETLVAAAADGIVPDAEGGAEVPWIEAPGPAADHPATSLPAEQPRRAVDRRTVVVVVTLRHSCGFYLADQGTDLRVMQDYLGHRSSRHTDHYTRVSGRKFESLWE